MFSSICQKAVDRIGRPHISSFLTGFQRGRRSTGTVDRILDFYIGRPIRSTDSVSAGFLIFLKQLTVDRNFRSVDRRDFRSTERYFGRPLFSLQSTRDFFKTVIFIFDCRAFTLLCLAQSELRLCKGDYLPKQEDWVWFLKLF